MFGFQQVLRCRLIRHDHAIPLALGHSSGYGSDIGQFPLHKHAPGVGRHRHTHAAAALATGLCHMMEEQQKALDEQKRQANMRNVTQK